MRSSRSHGGPLLHEKRSGKPLSSERGIFVPQDAASVELFGVQNELRIRTHCGPLAPYSLRNWATGHQGEG
jgi:hypothetical protein